MSDAPVNLPKLLRETAKAIRPLIEESLQLRDDFAAYRTSITEAGGDWMALKALVKAQVEDEREGKGEHTRVAKIIAKADASALYADILNLNENNSFPEPLTKAEEISPKATRANGLSPMTSGKEITHQHGVSGPQPHAVTYPNAGGGSGEPPATLRSVAEQASSATAGELESGPSVPVRQPVNSEIGTVSHGEPRALPASASDGVAGVSSLTLAAADSTVAALSDDLEIPASLRRYA